IGGVELLVSSGDVTFEVVLQSASLVDLRLLLANQLELAIGVGKRGLVALADPGQNGRTGAADVEHCENADNDESQDDQVVSEVEHLMSPNLRTSCSRGMPSVESGSAVCV